MKKAWIGGSISEILTWGLSTFLSGQAVTSRSLLKATKLGRSDCRLYLSISQIAPARGCRRLHFRTISSNSPHPLAATAYMDFREPEVPISYPSFTFLQEDILLVIFKRDLPDDDGRVFALNWQTGEMILVCDLSFDSYITSMC